MCHGCCVVEKKKILFEKFSNFRKGRRSLRFTINDESKIERKLSHVFVFLGK